ncbi:transposase [Streptomyces phaeoluteigriseus]|uniref:Transposase n=1 Tax=Streptomyces phaeoluteigriseus TaxID=114686 RepID=A0A1V6MYM5_9ACTN|nr:transposase [Streptomyces phaeoluteigriseus]
MSRFQFVDDHRDTYEVKRLCQVLDVNRSSYYMWLAGAEARAARHHKDRVLAEEIRQVHGESGGAYGSPRVTAELREKGRRVNEKRVARIMRTFSITGIRLRRRVRTTVPDPATSPVPDLFQRDLSIADHMRTSLVADALQMAAATRGGLDGAVFHSDHGAQYASQAFAGLCDQLGVTRSMGAVGTSADNAACESFHASLKRETLQGAHHYGDADACRRTVFAWLTRYNTRRRHSANGHLSPNEYERRHHTAKLTLAA